MSGRTDSRGTIVVVEDNPMLLQGLDRALTANGYRVATASSGRAALEMLNRDEISPDLLLVDVMMPDLTGFDVLRMLRADPYRSALPVVMITAATDSAVREAARQQGVADLLIKPFPLGELLERIEAHVTSNPGGISQNAPDNRRHDDQLLRCRVPHASDPAGQPIP